MADLETGVAAYSDIEEDFFRVGDEMSSAVSDDVVVVEPEPIPSKGGLWSRLFERPLRIPTDVSFVAEGTPLPPVSAYTRPPTERPVVVEEEPEEEDWEWMIAAARARSRPATSPGL